VVSRLTWSMTASTEASPPNTASNASDLPNVLIPRPCAVVAVRAAALIAILEVASMLRCLECDATEAAIARQSPSLRSTHPPPLSQNTLGEPVRASPARLYAKHTILHLGAAWTRPRRLGSQPIAREHGLRRLPTARRHCARVAGKAAGPTGMAHPFAGLRAAGPSRARRARPSTIAIAGLLVTAAVVGSAATRPKKNVLLVIVNHLAPVIEPYGHLESAWTPNMKAFAANATVFKRTYAQSPVMEASRVSMMMGRFPFTTGVHAQGVSFRNRLPLAQEGGQLLSMPQWFVQKGYQTQAVGEVLAASGGQSSTSSQCQAASSPADGCQDDSLSWSLGSQVPEGHTSSACRQCLDSETAPEQPASWATTCDDACIPDRWTADRAADAMRTMQAQRELAEGPQGGSPWLLAVGFRLPALPIAVPDAAFQPLRAQGLPLQAGAALSGPARSTWPTGATSFTRSRNAEPLAYSDVAEYGPANDSSTIGLIKAPSLLMLRKAYHAGVHYVDERFGGLMRALDGLGKGVVDNTVVAIVGDRGAGRGDLGAWDGQALLDSTLRTVMMIRNGSTRLGTPSSNGTGARTWALAQLVDLWPTLAELAIPNASLPAGLAGRSLVPAMVSPPVDPAGSSTDAQGGIKPAGLIGDVSGDHDSLPELSIPSGHVQAVFASLPRDSSCAAPPPADCRTTGDPMAWNLVSGAPMGVTALSSSGWRLVEWTAFDYPERRPSWQSLSDPSFGLELYDQRADDGTVPGALGWQNLAGSSSVEGILQRMRLLARDGPGGSLAFDPSYVPSDPGTVLPTATSRPTPSPSPSLAPSASATPQPSATGTPTPNATTSPTPNATSTASATTVPSATASMTSDPSFNATLSPTASSTPTPSTSPSGTATPTASISASATPSASVSPTSSGTPSPSASTTVTSTPSPSVSASPSGTASSTVSPSATITPSPSVSVSPAASLSSAPSTPVIVQPSESASPSAAQSPNASSNATTDGVENPVVRGPSSAPPPGPEADATVLTWAIAGGVAGLGLATVGAWAFVRRRQPTGRASKASQSKRRSRRLDGARHGRIARLAGSPRARRPDDFSGLMASPMAPEGAEGGGRALDVGIRLPSRSGAAGMRAWGGPSRAIATRTNPLGRGKRAGRRRSLSADRRAGHLAGAASAGAWAGGRVV